MLTCCFSQHPDVFRLDFITQELFRHVEVTVATRNFGYSIPSTSIIPMADMMNHSDIEVWHELFNKSLHLQDKNSESYYTRCKFMNDYSNIYDKE